MKRKRGSSKARLKTLNEKKGTLLRLGKKLGSGGGIWPVGFEGIGIRVLKLGVVLPLPGVSGNLQKT